MKTAPCVFLNSEMFVMCFVDYILIITSKQQKMDSIIRHIGPNLMTKDRGSPSHFLGIDFLWEEDQGSLLRQSNLLKSLLESRGMVSCNGIQSLLNPAVDLRTKEGEIVSWKFDHRCVT